MTPDTPSLHTDYAKELREAFVFHSSHDEYDMPGDTPEHCGYACNDCGVDHPADAALIQHKPHCSVLGALASIDAIAAELERLRGEVASMRGQLLRASLRIADALPYVPDHRARPLMMLAREEITAAISPEATHE